MSSIRLDFDLKTALRLSNESRETLKRTNLVFCGNALACVRACVRAITITILNFSTENWKKNMKIKLEKKYKEKLEKSIKSN